MASIQGIYLALFGRPADPAGLAYWNEQSKNGADLAKIIDVMTKAPEAVARFSGLSDAALVTGIYQALFDRAPDAAGLAFFTEQLKSGKQTVGSLAINILDGAGGNDLVLVQNREKAANAFTASLDTPAEIAAYSGSAAADFGRSFVKTVTTDPASIPTADKIQASINTSLPGASSGQAPAGGNAPAAGGSTGGGSTDPGTSTPPPAVGTIGPNKTLTISANADATLSLSNGSLIVSANGFSSSTVNAADVEKITLLAGAKLHTLGTTTLSQVNEISGAGTLDVQGVTFTNANGNLPEAKARFEPSPSLDGIYSKIAVGTGFTVNGNEADTIKGIWDVLDDRYTSAGYSEASVNADFINLGLRYVDFLTKGGSPFVDLVAKANTAVDAERSQSMHDNLLGNLNKASLDNRGFSDTEKAAFLARIPEAYENRPVYDGNKASVGGPNHDGARAFDYAKGWARPDYLDKQMSGKLDASAIKNNKELFVGEGNTVTGFNIVRHEGAGIELALKAKIRGGADYTPTDTNNDGFTEYRVDAGGAAAASWGTPAKWSFDYSVATGLNTQNAAKTLNDYKFKAFVDIDPTEKVNYLVFEMTKDPQALDNPAKTPWILVKDGQFDFTAGFKDEEKAPGDVNAKISQNSVNFGFGFIKNKIDSDTSTPAVIDAYNFTKATFDIEFKVYEADGVKELASNHIQVMVDGGWPMPV